MICVNVDVQVSRIFDNLRYMKGTFFQSVEMTSHSVTLVSSGIASHSGSFLIDGEIVFFTECFSEIYVNFSEVLRFTAS